MSLIKPDGITGLDSGHALYANVERFFELGQLDKELVGDTALTTTATTQTDADIGECLEFDSNADAITETVSFGGGGKTVLIVHKTTATFGDGAADVDFLDLDGGGHAVKINLRNGLQYSTTFRGAYGDYVIQNSNAVADQAAVDDLRCFAVTLSETGGIKYAVDGTIDASSVATTDAFSAPQNVSLMSAIGTATASSRVGAIVLFDKVLSDAELMSVTADPWAMVDVPPVRGITDIDTDNSVQAGQTLVSITTAGLDASPATQIVTLGGETLTVESWSATEVIVSIPLHINLPWGSTTNQLAITDDSGTVTLDNVSLTTANGWGVITFDGTITPVGSDSFYNQALADLSVTMVSGDTLAFQTNAGVTVDTSTYIEIDPPNTVTGDYKVYDVSNSTWSTVGTYTWVDGGTPPTKLTSRTIDLGLWVPGSSGIVRGNDKAGDL